MRDDIIEICSAADLEKLPIGFFLVRTGDKEGVGYNSPVFGVMWDVPSAFALGGLVVTLDRPRKSLPVVQFGIPQQRDGFANVGGHLVADTAHGEWNGETAFDHSDAFTR